MTEELNAQSFDLIGALSGRDYPELEVTIYLNETLGFEVSQLQEEIQIAEKGGDLAKSEELYEALQAKIKKAAGEAYSVTLKAIPESVRRKIHNQIAEDFPEKTDVFGRPQIDPEADEAFTKKMWQAYIRSVKNPLGQVKKVDEADINALYANAPNAAHVTITSAIRKLQEGATAGYEHVVQELGFLSQASPEG